MNMNTVLNSHCEEHICKILLYGFTFEGHKDLSKSVTFCKPKQSANK